MPRSPALLVAAGAIALTLGLSAPIVALGGPNTWIKFLFPPQAGYNSTCLSCGWHDGACSATAPAGPALDFDPACSDTGTNVYLRNFGFLPAGRPRTVVGHASYVIPPEWQCNEVQAWIWDTQGTLLGIMRYVHAANPWPSMITLLATDTGYPNDHWFALMVNPEKSQCISNEWWTAPHVHEAHVDEGGTFLLRDGGDCGQYDRYPCGPAPSLPYNPQDWWNDWARELCIGDADCDLWTDNEEDIIGTDPTDGCGANAWPPDLQPNNCVNGADILKFIGRFAWMAPYNPRYDLKTNGRIDGADVLVMIPVMNTCCTP